MERYYLCDLLIAHVLTEFLERKLDVLGGNVATVVSVELLVDGLQSLFRQELLGVDRGGKELAPVDLAIALVVQFFDHVVNLLLTK